jgi:RHS repeat-associated protein
LVQEQSYYPFGLQMAAISDKALLKTTTAEKFNAGNELEEGIEYYNTFYRKYDAQIGRFTGIDMLAESFAGITPYQFGNNNPVSNNDPMGDKWTDQNGNSHAGPNPFAFSGYAGGQALWEEGGMGFGGGGGGGGGGQYGTFWQSLWNKVSENGGGYFSDFTSNRGNRNGNAGMWFTYSYSLNNGQYGGFGNMSTMGEVVMGNTFVRDVKGVRDNGGGADRYAGIGGWGSAMMMPSVDVNKRITTLTNNSKSVIWFKPEDNKLAPVSLAPGNSTSMRIDGVTHPLYPGQVYKVIDKMDILFGVEATNSGICIGCNSLVWPMPGEFNALGGGGWLSQPPYGWEAIFDKAGYKKN